jgi:intergrase/recombinase
MNNTQYLRLCNSVRELQEYIELQNDESGEAYALLCQFTSYTDYISTEFAEAVLKEVERKLKYFKETTVIEEVPVVEKTYNQKRLKQK